MFSSPLQEVTRKLTAVATGREKADLVIRNTCFVNVNTAEIQPGIDIAIAAGRIALVGDAAHTIGEHTEVVNGTGYYAVPGFMDGHIHVESSMMTVQEYAKAVLPHGTTSIYPDPHEIANIAGLKGIEFMIENGKDTPLRVFTVMPSCVPAVPGFEDTGAVLSPQDIAHFMEKDEIAGLGEIMNYPGVVNGDPETHQKLYATLAAGKTVTGHYAIPETGPGLNAYIAAGARCCHESVRKEDALAKMRLGMYAQIREGSAWRDLTEVIRCILDEKIDTRFATLVSDDTHPHTLIEHGHMDHIVARAIEEGVDPVTAIQMATINTAQCYGMERDLGSISPGKLADILLLSDLEKVKVHQVYVNGKLVAENGHMCVDFPPKPVPSYLKNTMGISNSLTPADFQIAAPEHSGQEVTARVIEVIGARVGTRSVSLPLPVSGGYVKADAAKDTAKMVVIDRHHHAGSWGKGFVRGFGLQAGAVASTVAHDAHNLSILGMNDADMALAGNTLIECGGGMVAVRDGAILALLPLPVGGILCEEPAEAIARKVDQLDKAWKDLGCTTVSPFMTMALIPLAVLPELRLTNRGLVDTNTFQFVDLFPQV